MSGAKNYSANGEVTPSNAEVSEQQVLDYLKSSPDFFRQHPEAIANLSLPHQSGNAVSLVERQVAVLRERSIQTRHKLSELVDVAKDNDQIFSRTQKLVIALLKASSIDQLCEEVIRQFKTEFGVEKTAVVFISDPESTPTTLQNSRFLKSFDLAQQSIGHLIEPQTASQSAASEKSDNTLCGILRDNESEFIFDTAHAVGSAAVACRELGEYSTLLLAVANSDTDHYSQQTGTLFIDYLADILALRTQQLL